MLDVGSTGEALLYIMQEMFSRDDHEGFYWPYSHY